MSSISLYSAVAMGVLVAGQASAAIITCDDTSGVRRPGNKNASSALDVSVGASVSTSNCGPHGGNDSNSLTASDGGYGYNMSADNGTDGGWIELDKADGSDSTYVTGTGWGTTSGTFSFVDNTGFGEYLIALKFSNIYATYLSDTVATNWGWDTDTDTDGGYAISHLTVYGRATGSTTTTPSFNVTEPTTFLLGSLAFASFGFARRKVKS